MAEDLAEYLAKSDVKVRYIHSEIQEFRKNRVDTTTTLGQIRCLGRYKPTERRT